MSKIIVANWKMNLSIEQSETLINEILPFVERNDTSTIICPPFTALEAVSKLMFGNNLELGAQNMHSESNGAFTGEISASMLKDIGCKYVILGHSERRLIFNETDKLINLKIKQALKHNIIPIVCVGESLEQKQSNSTKEHITNQIKESLNGVKSQIIVAYEPIWAIGTGKTATPMEAQEVHALIRSLLKSTKILYGGSVNPGNIKDLMKMPDIDGALVGGASLKSESFGKIINS